MTEYQDVGATTTVDDNVPPGITPKQDEIIQYVAKYVIASCDAARYQEKVRTRTKHNPYFDFLNPMHAYHHYYRYLLESYRHWMQNNEAAGVGVWGGTDGMAAQGQDYPLQPQQEWTEEDAYQYYGGYAGQSSGIDFHAGGEGYGGAYADGYYNASTIDQRQQYPSGGGETDPTAWSPESATAPAAMPAPASGYYASPGGVATAPAATDGEGPAQEEEDDGEEYELVMEDGQWVSRKRSSTM